MGIATAVDPGGGAGTAFLGNGLTTLGIPYRFPGLHFIHLET